jgi:uncharacterized membrane protein
MQPKVLLQPFYILAAALVGLGDTLYLSYYHWINITPTCAIGGCEIVLQSKWSMIGGTYGIPFAYVGLFFYAYFIALAILLMIDPYSKGLRFGLVAYATIGLLLSIGFELFQIVVIHAICMYCALSALMTLALFCVAIWHWRSTRTLAN